MTVREKTYTHKQQGMALAISLVLMVAMTIVALASMSGSKLSEKIASNSQQKAISFEAAESVIAATWTTDTMVDVLGLIAAASFDNPPPVVPVLPVSMSDVLDQTGSGTVKTVDLTAAVTVQYCGETNLPRGSSLNVDESTGRMVGVLLDVKGEASIAGSSAYSDHLRRGYLIRPASGRAASCVTPK